MRGSIPPRDRLIVALDIPDTGDAKRFVAQLGEHVSFYKLGLEIFMDGQYVALAEWLAERGKKVFVDLKFFDVPQTVGAAVRQLGKYRATFATVHGNDAIMRAACAEKRDVKILAVTALTSLDQKDMDDLGFATDMRSLVLSRARRAQEIGCDGVVASGEEAGAIRERLGDRLLIVVPGIRPVKNIDDQKRTVDLEHAFRAGADYVVVGRPIRTAPDPAKAAADMQARIARLFAG